MNNRLYDIVVFGVTGFTGQYVLEELSRSVEKEKLKIAIAGRNEKKLKDILQNSSQYLESIGEKLGDIPIIIADINNEKSLLEMCQKTQLVLNCVGPYTLYGEPVVKACLVTGTHHLDISGEPLFLENMQLKYHEEAKEKGIYIIGACGFDSIPCDVGISLIKKKFQGDINSVETYLQFNSRESEPINTGTWKSLVNGIHNAGLLKDVRRQLNQRIFKKHAPKYPYPADYRYYFRSELTNNWYIPFPGSDKTVSVRSQLYNYNVKNERPVQIRTYLKQPVNLLLLALFGIILFVLSSFEWGRNLLIRHPKFFSGGKFQEGGPTREQVKGSSFSIIFLAKGWNEKLDPMEKHAEPPNKSMKVVLTAPDAAYISTSACLVKAGIVVLKENDKMPERGGVITPGAAFADTSLVERLQQFGFKFEFEEM